MVGIHGRWGTGKSSLLNMLDEQLQAVSPEAPVIFRFNPWGFSDKNQLSDRFFAELSAFLKLHMSIPSLSGMSETVEEYGQLLSPMARLIFPRAAEAVRFGWKWFRKYRPARQRSLAELKVQINLGLSDSGSKLIILIDDIDRLNNEEIREVFQLIKLNANFSNTVYVVAFDKNLVQKALRKVAPGRPQEYLEKIVQIPFDLPVIAESTLTEIIIANFNQILASVKLQKASTQRFGNMFHSGFRESFRTIRDVNRYFNLFKFAFNLMRHDTDFVDLAAVEAVALFYPVVYKDHRGQSRNVRWRLGGARPAARRSRTVPCTVRWHFFKSGEDEARIGDIALSDFCFRSLSTFTAGLMHGTDPNGKPLGSRTRGSPA